jgi:hypothetical protein
MIRRAWIRAAVFLAALTVGGCSSRPAPDSAEKTEPAAFTVSGRVAKDSRTKSLEPTNVTMTEVVVDNKPSAGPGKAGFFESEVATDGAFRFENVPAGRYIARLVPAPLGAVPVTIDVNGGDVKGVELTVPFTVALSGRIEVEGNGLTPRFNVICGNISISTNGTSRFSIDVPEGEHKVSVAGLPKGYSTQSILYGSTDVLTTPLLLASGEPPRELILKLGVSSPPPWARVRGQLTRGGQPVPAPAQSRIALTGLDVRDRFEAPIRPDGSFELSRVLVGKYNARLTPEITGMDPVRLTVEGENINDWKIALPRPEVRVRVVVAGGGAPPNFQLIFYDVPLSSADPSITANRAIPINPEGTFVTILPPGEYPQIKPNALPAGYTVKSFMDGSTDLLKRPLKIDGKNTKELVLTLVKKSEGK